MPKQISGTTHIPNRTTQNSEVLIDGNSVHHCYKPFRLAVHPKRWQILEGQFLPIIKKVTFEEGLRGQKQGGSIQDAVHIMNKKGWKILDPQVIGPSYIKSFINYQGRNVYLAPFEKVMAGQPTPEPDTKLLAAFAAKLIELGIVEEPSLAVINRLTDNYSKKLDILRQKNAEDTFAFKATAELLAIAEAEREKISERYSNPEVDEVEEDDFAAALAPKKTTTKRGTKKSS